MKYQDDIQRRILFIIHRGLVELRLLARSGNCLQAFDLADTLEVLPARVSHWKDEDLQWVREALVAYEARYPKSFRYSQFLREVAPPDDF